LGAFLAKLRELGLDELAPHSPDLVFENAAAGGLTALDQVPFGLVEKVTLPERVAGPLFCLFDDVEAFCDFTVGIPVRAFEFAGKRKRMFQGIRLFDDTRPVPRNVTRAGVYHRYIPQIAGQVDDRLRAKRIHFEGYVERWLKIDDSRGVDDCVNRAVKCTAELVIEATEGLCDIAVDRDYLALEKRPILVAIPGS
jgi:hypothetical protein